MGLRALTGGFALLALIAFWRLPAGSGPARQTERLACPAGDASSICCAIAGLATAFRNPMLRVNRASLLPPPGTPGAINPAVTQVNIEETICRSGYARGVRPPYAVTGPYKHRLMEVQHPGERLADYELDHLIPISIGGAPFDERDLWLQPRVGPANAADKNLLAYVLWRLVCERRLPLATAQQAISSDWTAAYAMYATPENVAKYHFQHAEDDPE